MTTNPEQKMKQAYEAMVHVALYNHPLSEIEPNVADDFMGYGSALDETVYGWKDFKWMVERQREEIGKGEVTIKRIPLVQQRFSNGTSALIVEEFEFTTDAGEEPHGFTLRLSTVLDLQEDKWMIRHFHGSTADADTPEGNAWPIEEWKRRNAELQRVVAAKTHDLKEKYRELEIEAALERVRAKSMAMHKSEDLADLSLELVQQVQHLGIETWFCAFNINDGDEKGGLEWGSNGQGVFPKYRTPREGIFLEYYNVSQSGESLFIKEIGEEECPAHYDYLCSLPGVGEQLLKIKEEGIPFPTSQIDHVAFFKYGYILFITFEPVPESHDIFKRFAKVFEQTYTRFLDLQKAEEQAREAQIEAAMERVRSKAMAMQKADELVEVAALLRKEMGFLGVEELETSSIYINDESLGQTECWFSIQDQEQEDKLISDYMTIDLNDTWVGRQMLKFYESDEKKCSIVMKGRNRTEWINYCAEQSDLFSAEGFYGKEIPERTYHLYRFSNGYMGAAAPGNISEESWNLLRRATTVFSLAYTRFSDLQTAEAQARESHIELALERARNQSMLMKHSEELNQVSNVFHEQLLQLGIPTEFSYVWLPNEKNQTHMFWATWSENLSAGEVGKLTYHTKAITNTLDKTEPYTAACYEMWESDQSVFVNPIPPVEVDEFFTSWSELLSDAEHMKAELFPDGLYYAEAYIKYGCFGINIRRALTKEEEQVLQRFSIEFERAYTRFLDLKKAEQQAREAQIEAALERVRSASMAMHKTDELAEVVEVLFQQFSELDLDFYQVWINIFFLEEGYSNCWFSPVEGVFEEAYTAVIPLGPFEDTSIKSWRAGEEFSYLSWRGLDEVDQISKELSEMTGHPSFAEIQQKKRMDRMEIVDSNHQYGVMAMAKNDDITDEDQVILKRFTRAFEQAYTRFLDLQKAEAQAREAQIEVSLEKVRSRTMAMQHSNELPDAANVLFLQVQGLGIPAWSCGYNILSADKKSSTCIMSSEGEIQIPFTLPLNEHESLLPWYEAVENKEEFFVYEQGGKDLVEHYRYMSSLPELVATFQQFEEANIPLPTFQVNHLARFTNGFLLFITYERVPEAHDIFKRFAKVFEQTYTRFLDLQTKEEQSLKIKEEKERLENTLSELKTTQKQLIHAEKMASLGELTAGIAHEIQNPLNFVNNFSDVSKELILEMKEELENGDMGEAIAITEDLIQNLDKIHHHGKRADGIVKGMLDHSRTSSGEKIPTDINALADEYLRLSYHGLRAKDKSFNCALETHFDPKLKKIQVIPQDIGRVLLNVFNNAFYACSARSAGAGAERSVRTEPNAPPPSPKGATTHKMSTGQSADSSKGATTSDSDKQYKPVVTLTTKRLEDTAIITISDNGIGMSKDTLEKVFQPFFTTKPTGSGTGLGMSISYDIITKGHGGELKVESKEGEGSQFIIQLPSNKST